MSDLLSRLNKAYEQLSAWFFSLDAVAMGAVIVGGISLLIALIPLIIQLIDKWNSRKLDEYFRDGKRFRAGDLKYVFFPNHRVDSVYAEREIDNELITKIKNGKHIILIGPPLRGKTRTITECIKQLTKTDCIIAKVGDYKGNISFPRKRWFTKKHLLILDDIHEFFKPPYNATHLINEARDKGFTLIGTCRSTAEWAVVQNAYDTISRYFEVIELEACTEKEIKAALRSNDLIETPNHFDNENIGTLFIDLDAARDWYSKANDMQRTILCAIKEAAMLGLANSANKISLKDVKELAQKGHDLMIGDNEFNKAIQWAKDHAFIEKDDIKPVICPKDVIFAKVVTPNIDITEVIAVGIKAFTASKFNFAAIMYPVDLYTAKKILAAMELNAIKPSVDEYNELISKETSFNNAITLYEKMKKAGITADVNTYFRLLSIHLLKGESLNAEGIRVFDQANNFFTTIKNDYTNDEVFWHGWGDILAFLAEAKDNNKALYHDTFERYEHATKIKSDYDKAFNNWGNALAVFARAKDNDVTLFTEAIKKYKRTIKIKSNSHNAYYNWGIVLADLAGAKDFDEALYSEAIDKYQRAIKIKPDYHEAYYNWGNALVEIAIAKEHDEALFTEAFKKFEHSIKIKSDFNEAYTNWGNALAELAVTKKNDGRLLDEAINKYKYATEIKLDDHEAYYGWGTALAKLAIAQDSDEVLFNEAIDKYERATNIKHDYHEAYNNWGLALSILAIAKKNDEVLFSEAVDKYKRAVGIKRDYHKAYCNWGEILFALAIAKENDVRLFNEAIDKYKRAIKIKPDDHETYYSLASALIILGESLNDPKYYQHAIEIFIKLKDLGLGSYILACAYALLSDKEKALFELDLAFKNKDVELSHVKEDDNWDGLRDDPDFVALIARYEADDE